MHFQLLEFVHDKLNETRLSSPESGCLSCLTSCRMAKDLGF